DAAALILKSEYCESRRVAAPFNNPRLAPVREWAETDAPALLPNATTRPNGAPPAAETTGSYLDGDYENEVTITISTAPVGFTGYTLRSCIIIPDRVEVVEL